MLNITCIVSNTSSTAYSHIFCTPTSSAPRREYFLESSTRDAIPQVACFLSGGLQNPVAVAQPGYIRNDLAYASHEKGSVGCCTRYGQAHAADRDLSHLIGSSCKEPLYLHHHRYTQSPGKPRADLAVMILSRCLARAVADTWAHSSPTQALSLGTVCTIFITCRHLHNHHLWSTTKRARPQQDEISYRCVTNYIRCTWQLTFYIFTRFHSSPPPRTFDYDEILGEIIKSHSKVLNLLGFSSCLAEIYQSRKPARFRKVKLKPPKTAGMSQTTLKEIKISR